MILELLLRDCSDRYLRSSIRSKFNVVSETCRLRNLLLELCCPLTQATFVYCDNVTAIYLSSKANFREKVKQGELQVSHFPYQYQIADIFTMGLPKILFDDFRASFSIRKLPDSTAGCDRVGYFNI